MVIKSLSKWYKVSNKIVTFSQFKPPVRLGACLSVPAIMSLISDSVHLGKFFKAACHEISMRLFINNACNSKLTNNYPAHIQLLKLAFPVSGATKTITGPELLSS